MEIPQSLVRMVEYCLCESALEIYPKIQTNSRTFNAFCGRLRDSIMRGNLDGRDERVLRYMMFRATREFRVPSEELSVICANFFVDEKWNKYIKAIKLMDNVRWTL